MGAEPALWGGSEGKNIMELNRGIGTCGHGGACGGDGVGMIVAGVWYQL